MTPRRTSDVSEVLASGSGAPPLEVIQRAAWEFNEAVSLLREARLYVPDELSAAEEIDDGLPSMQAALEELAQITAAEPPSLAKDTP